MTVLLAGAGCATQKSPPPHYTQAQVTAAVTSLRNEPVPLPARTPFDSRSDRRAVYLKGFRDGWNFAVNGGVLAGMQSQPADLPEDLLLAWKTGWARGSELGESRLLAQLNANPNANPN